MASRWSSATLLACALLAGAPVAYGRGSDAEPAINLPGRLGLTGFQDMVDARVPSLLSVRGGLRYDALVENKKIGGVLDAELDREQHQFGAFVGVSALGLLDAAVRFPFVYRRDTAEVDGLPDPSGSYDQGWGDIDVAGKVAIGLGPIVLAPYAWGKLPTGEPDVGDVAELEWGGAATFSILNEYVAVHANLAGVNIEGGETAFRYRLGASVVVFASEALLVRVYGYGDGVEYEGHADSDFDLDLGVQTIFMKIFYAELGGSVRLVDAGTLDDDFKDGAGAAINSFDRHIDDDGTWGLSLALGVTLDF